MINVLIPSQSTYVGKRTSAGEVLLGSFSTRLSVEECLMTTSDNTVVRAATYINKDKFELSKYNFDGNKVTVDFKYLCTGCVSGGLILRVTRELMHTYKGGGVCFYHPLNDQPVNNGPFVDSLNSSSSQDISKGCWLNSVTVRVDVVQQGAALTLPSALKLLVSDLPRTVVEVYTGKVPEQVSIYRKYFYMSDKDIVIAPSPSCTFTPSSQSLQVALSPLLLSKVNPQDQLTPMSPKSFSLGMTGCSDSDKTRPVNLTWKFNKPSARHPSRLSNAAENGGTGVDLMVTAQSNQKMDTTSGLPYSDLTIKNLETYRALNQAGDTNLNFTAAYVANGEPLKAGPFSSTATVTIGYE